MRMMVLWRLYSEYLGFTFSHLVVVLPIIVRIFLDGPSRANIKLSYANLRLFKNVVETREYNSKHGSWISGMVR